ncbi:MAG: ATP-dependent Clp protease adaptor ClpS [Bacteroidales bacterium]|nr:ATP-dependent Clp protease adaptor ClpS [Bacteroidales bacterium]MDD4575397.1 ATP-dependent Clp protease adaptor ClpS [Bacteroidales bacterium]
MVKEENETISDYKSEQTSQNQLILLNDDVNSFDYVVDTLIDICEHDPLQAEQCAWITHHKGKCVVKQGEKTKLVSMRRSIIDRGLNAEIHN